ncbi:Lipase member K [Halotydeus destructor]|nr:Lipase member K [Halotydeus destructor]
MLMALATHEELNEVVKPAILMAFGEVPPTDINTDPVSLFIGNTLNQVALPVLPKMKLTSTVLTAICSPPIQDACAILLQLVVGFDPENLNKTRFPVYISQVPAGSSTWKTAQDYQTVRKDCYPKFSYGPVENRRKYGQDEPPCYNLSRVTNRFIGAFIGKNDQVTPYSENTLSLLGVNPVFEKYTIPYEKWSHADYVIAKSIGRYIVPKVIMTIHRALSSA